MKRSGISQPRRRMTFMAQTPESSCEDVRGAAFTGKVTLTGEVVATKSPGASNRSGYLGVQAAPQASDELGFRHRLVEQKALPDLAADRLQLVAFVRRFNAFGDGSKTETTAELDDRLAQAGIELVSAAIRYIGAVDFQLAEGRIASRRTNDEYAGAEIVDREVAFEFPQRFGNVFRQLQIVNDLVFSNLRGQTRPVLCTRASLAQHPGNWQIDQSRHRHVGRSQIGTPFGKIFPVAERGENPRAR